MTMYDTDHVSSVAMKKAAASKLSHDKRLQRLLAITPIEKFEAAALDYDNCVVCGDYDCEYKQYCLDKLENFLVRAGGRT